MGSIDSRSRRPQTTYQEALAFAGVQNHPIASAIIVTDSCHQYPYRLEDIKFVLAEGVHSMAETSCPLLQQKIEAAAVLVGKSQL